MMTHGAPVFPPFDRVRPLPEHLSQRRSPFPSLCEPAVIGRTDPHIPRFAGHRAPEAEYPGPMHLLACFGPVDVEVKPPAVPVEPRLAVWPRLRAGHLCRGEKVPDCHRLFLIP